MHSDALDRAPERSPIRSGRAGFRGGSRTTYAAFHTYEMHGRQSASVRATCQHTLAVVGLLAIACGVPTTPVSPLPCPRPGVALARAPILFAAAGRPVRVTVLLHPGVPDLPGAAAYLTLRHGGRLLHLNVGGFTLELPPDAFAQLEAEPQVCAVERLFE